MLRGSRRASAACAFCCRQTLRARNIVLYEDDLVMGITDHNPRANEHVLVISQAHIASVNELQQEDLPLVTHMIETGRKLLAEKGYQDSEQYRMGFHRPPFTSVQHLHLHCLGLPFLPAWNRWRFTPMILNSYIAADMVLEQLQSDAVHQR